MVGTDEPAVFDLAARKRGTAVNAKILEYAYAFRNAEGDEPLAQEGEGFRLVDYPSLVAIGCQ